MNINKMKKAELILEVESLRIAVQQLTAAKSYPTPKATGQYVDHDKQAKTAAHNSNTLPPRPATAAQLSRLLMMFCTHKYVKFAFPKDLTVQSVKQLMEYMDNTTLKTVRVKPDKSKYSDMDCYYADYNAYYAPQAEWVSALSKKYPTEAGRLQTVLNRYKDPVAYDKLDALDKALKAEHDAFYKRAEPSEIGYSNPKQQKSTLLYYTETYGVDWAWTLDSFIYKGK